MNGHLLYRRPRFLEGYTTKEYVKYRIKYLKKSKSFS
jgi:hypothetical protein